MSLKEISSRLALAAGAAATVIVSFAGAAAAQHRRGPGHAPQGYHAPAPRHAAPYHHAPPPVYHERRNSNGDKIAKGIAIGVGAAILGAILLNEANRRPHLPD